MRSRLDSPTNHKEKIMLRGLTTTTFHAADLNAASDWYSDLFGIEPYYVVPDGYIEFRIGDYSHEFGIVNAAYANPGQVDAPAGAVAYWAVDDIDAALATLLEKGATPYQPIITRGEGFITAAVVDPFGNILGIMYNQHYLDVLAGLSAGTAADA